MNTAIALATILLIAFNATNVDALSEWELDINFREVGYTDTQGWLDLEKFKAFVSNHFRSKNFKNDQVEQFFNAINEGKSVNAALVVNHVTKVDSTSPLAAAFLNWQSYQG